MHSFLIRNWGTENIQRTVSLIASDAGISNLEDWLGINWQSDAQVGSERVAGHLDELMAHDSKATGLKAIQGMVWQSGFESGALRAELFDDVLPALRDWKSNGLDIEIYSSGSVLAQKMFFQHTTVGDLSSFFNAHYDTTIGTKKETSSYQKIASDCQRAPSEIVFITDVYAEITAAESAGMQVIASVRPNNVALPVDFDGIAVKSFSQLSISKA